MCRIVIFNKARLTEADPIREAGRYRVGDVVQVLEDGAELGTDIDLLGWFQIVDVPGVPKFVLFGLQSPMVKDIDETKIPRKRQFQLPIEPTMYTVKTRGEVEASATRNEYVQEIAFLGPSESVLGGG
jgi:hypothetical protein